MSSVYASQPDLAASLFIAISQSGASPDLLAPVEAAKRAGRIVVALVNADGSPLARAAQITSCRCAPAPKPASRRRNRYIASLAAIVQLVASWTQDH